MNRALLLDRDGVINRDEGYVGAIGRFAFMAGLFAFLRAAQDRGYLLAIATNQSGVARGLYSEQDYDQVTQHMLQGLKKEGIDIALSLASFAHPEGRVPGLGRDSFWRKPNPGMVLEIVRRLRLDAARSAFLGDSLRDMQAAQAGGIGTCLWLTQEKPPAGIIAVQDFDEALLHLARTRVEQA